MKTKHTAGPWEIHGHNIEGKILIGKKGEKYNTGKIVTIGWNCCGKDSEEWKANAKLIAAAPELLQMVNELKNSVKRLTEDNLSQEDRDKEAQWIGEAHELLYKINPDYYTNANEVEEKKETTDVIFLIDNIFLIDKETNIIPSEVYAFFPNEHYHSKGHTLYNVILTSYGHVGQHSACHIDYAKESKEANPEQYKDLKAELESIGYSLNILSKSTLKKGGKNA